MKTTIIAGKTYTQKKCWCDNGRVYDATNADKIATGGRTTDACSGCRGKGYTLHLATASRPAPVRTPEPVGEIPDWML